MSDLDPNTRIACAAIKMADGTIYCGPNHAWIFKHHPAKGGEQGFVNYGGAFLRRKPALFYAMEHGQIVTKHNPTDQLLSEDLWNAQDH